MLSISARREASPITESISFSSASPDADVARDEFGRVFKLAQRGERRTIFQHGVSAFFLVGKSGSFLGELGVIGLVHEHVELEHMSLDQDLEEPAIAQTDRCWPATGRHPAPSLTSVTSPPMGM